MTRAEFKALWAMVDALDVYETWFVQTDIEAQRLASWYKRRRNAHGVRVLTVRGGALFVRVA